MHMIPRFTLLCNTVPVHIAFYWRSDNNQNDKYRARNTKDNSSLNSYVKPTSFNLTNTGFSNPKEYSSTTPKATDIKKHIIQIVEKTLNKCLHFILNDILVSHGLVAFL